MPSVSARAFQIAFERTLTKGGRLSAGDVKALAGAAARIKDASEARAAAEVLALVKHDRLLDRDEVEPARKALCRLLGVSPRGLPPSVERVLKNAVPVPNVRVQQYDLSFDFSERARGEPESFPARAVITLEDAAGPRSILEADPERLVIDEVRAAGKSVPFTMGDGRLTVTAPGARRLDIRYRVRPTDDTSGYGLVRDRHAGRMWTLTWPYNTGALFPSTSRPHDGATARVTVKVTRGEHVVSAGKQQADGAFHLDRQVPAYAISFYTGRFVDGGTSQRSNGVDVRLHGLGSKVPEATRRELRTTVAKAVEFFSSWLGEYPFGDRLNVVEIESEYGGMEHAGAVAVGVGQARADTVEAGVHEAAHHWFGDGVRIAHWGELWMSEGFTNYATFRFFRHHQGEGKFHALLDAAKETLREQLGKHHTQPLRGPSTSDPQAGLTWVPYMHGVWMLRMLEVKLGTAKLDGLLRAWFQHKRHQAVDTDDFIRFAEASTGERLRPFFAAWDHLQAMPSVRDKSKIEGSTVTFKLAPRTPVPAGVGIPVTVRGRRGEIAQLTIVPGEERTVDVGFPVRKLEWDPERTVMCDVG
ncbi:MAG: hypothetical protein A2138_17045 [Deltaproteobacteria bacterium RBG_16_71_12]|nr:MAG: hypothetical protein A2138_17045 [Deltaproteobacteria bacterium RBG_16_71_12]